MGRRNHVLDGGPEVLRDVAIATNFRTGGAICYNCFVGFNFRFISERELTFTFAICCRPSVCRLSVYLAVTRLSVTLVRPTHAVQIFGNISMAFGTMAIH